MTLAGFLRKSLEGTLFGVFSAGAEKVDEGNPKNPFPHGTGSRGVATASRGAACRLRGRWDELPVPRESSEEWRGFSTEQAVLALRRVFLL